MKIFFNMAKIEFIKEMKGYKLIIFPQDQIQNIFNCSYCLKPIKENTSYYCKQFNKLIHRKCERRTSKRTCRSSAGIHAHLNIVMVENDKMPLLQK